MKAVISWVVLANARVARVYEHAGPGKGLTARQGKTWHAAPLRTHRDRAGVGHSIAGPGIRAVEQTHLRDLNDAQFAKDVIGHLSKAYLDKSFDRLILVAGPHMLGLLRTNLDTPLSAALLGEIPKDFSNQPLSSLEAQLGELIAI